MALQLTTAQSDAIRHVRATAARTHSQADTAIQHLLEQNKIGLDAFTEVAQVVATRGQIELNFHPDRKLATGESIAEAMLREGVYRSQFETGISNGSRTAFPGGSRDLWEKRFFGNAYQQPGVTNSERPKYGALNLMNYSDGAAPRFGSCFFCLCPTVSQRSTFSYGDSVFEPDVIGTTDSFEGIWLVLLNDVATIGSALSSHELTIAGLLTRITRNLTDSDLRRFDRPPGRALDDYIEAQVHGTIDLSTDVDHLVADMSFWRTRTGEVLERLCDTYSIELVYHRGFTLRVDEVPADFRGPEMPRLARRIAGDGEFDVTHIGEAAASLHERPDAWSNWGTYDETLQHLKQLWHVLVQYGRPKSVAQTKRVTADHLRHS